MKFAWRNNILDLAAWNSGQYEEVDLDEYREMLEEDKLEEDKLVENFDDPQDDVFILENFD
jgi:hypothetical protein